MLTLKDIPIGQTAVVLRLRGGGAVRRRIMDMGVTRGAVLTVQKMAPLGDPVEIRLRDTAISLRKSDCAAVEVVPC